METGKRLIKPSQPGGVIDFLPKDMIPRQQMLDCIRTVFELYGFVPLHTPCMEFLEVLTGGEGNISGQIYKVRSSADRTDEHVRALRFDLTVPLARVVAAYPELPTPWKRYQMGTVFRGEKSQAGRYNEFMQCDVDTVGSPSMLADAEIIAVMYSVMTALGVPDFLIRVNNRKILNGLAEFAGFDPKLAVDVLRIIDKQDKIGLAGVIKLLLNGDTELGIEAQLELKQANQIETFLSIEHSGHEELLEKVSALMENSPMAREGIRELLEIVKYVRWLGVPDNAWTIDLSVARGLGYYTGPVFETILTTMPTIGSVFSGGRYDGLVSRFSPLSVPATGASVGLDRLFTALSKMNLITNQTSTAKVIILPFDEDDQVIATCAECANALRTAGIATDLFLGKGKPKELIIQAVKSGIPIAIIIGNTEIKLQNVMIRDLRSRKQESVPLTSGSWEPTLQQIKNLLG